MTVADQSARPSELERRARATLDRARAQLQDPAPTGDADAVADEVARTWQDLLEVLDATPPTAPAEALRLCELFVEATQVQQDVREQEVEARLEALGRIHASLARLGALRTPAELIDAAPAELCRCCDFDRALISRVRGSTWVPEVIHIAEGADPEQAAGVRDYLASLEIPLGSMLLETELVRRGTPALVEDPRNHPRTHAELMAVAQTDGYVAAPIMPGNRVIGFLHADTRIARRSLSPADRDNLWTFAEGFGLVFERVVLLQRLGSQRERVREAFQSAETMLEELTSSQVQLARQEREPIGFVSRPTQPKPTTQESRLHALLTPREREVLALMASGATNKQIADQLVISQGTVKSHVKHVLRKLRASTRAEAVSRSLHLSMSERP